MTDEQISNLMPRVNQEWAGFPSRAALHRRTVCRVLLMHVFLVAALTTSASALSIDLTSGTAGSIDLNQSFNEARAADITVLGVVNQVVDSMTVSGVDIRAPSLVGARIYDDITQSAIATANVLVPVGEQQTITIPISATLIAGKSYRVTFWVPPPGGGVNNAGNLFVPTGGFGYVESQGLFRVNGGWDSSPLGDVFPATTNLSIPQMLGFDVVPEPSSVALLALGLAGLCLREKSSRHLRR